MKGNFLLVDREDLKEVLSEILSDIVGKSQQVDNHQSDDKWLTRNEVCERLHVTCTTLWRMERRGDISAHKIGRKNLYSVEDVNSLIYNNVEKGGRI